MKAYKTYYCPGCGAQIVINGVLADRNCQSCGLVMRLDRGAKRREKRQRKGKKGNGK